MYSGSRCLRKRAQRRRVERGPRRGDDVGHQPLVAGHVLAGHHHGLAHAGVLAQRRPRSRPARCGSRAPSPGSRRGRGTPARRPAASAPGRPCGTAARRALAEKGSGTKRSAVSSGPVAGSRAPGRAADEQLARHAHGHRLQVRVQHVHAACWPGAGRWARRPCRACGRAVTRPVSATTVRLGGAVAVDSTRAGAALQHAAPRARGARTSPPVQQPARSAGAALRPAPSTRAARRRGRRAARTSTASRMQRAASAGRSPARSRRDDARSAPPCSSAATELAGWRRRR